MIIETFAAMAEPVKVRAVHLCDRIDTRALEKTRLMAASPLMLELGPDRCAAIFRYGVVVFFNVPPLEEAKFIQSLEGFATPPMDERKSEEIGIRIGPEGQDRLVGSVMFLQGLSLASLQVVADVLAKSVVLDHYEAKVARSFDLVEPIAVRLKERGERGAHARELLQHIGEVLINQHNMVGRVEVAEKPDLIWDKPQLERLHALLVEEFEIRERHLQLERKLELIARTAETMLDLLQTKRGQRLEWYIVFLIVFEILLTLYEMFFRHG